MDCSPPGTLSMELPREEHWSGWPSPSPGDLPDPGIEPASPAWAGGFFTAEHQGGPHTRMHKHITLSCESGRKATKQQGLTFLQSWQNTEELPRRPSASPQSRHWERPFPITWRLMVSSRSTSRLRQRTQGQTARACLQPDGCLPGPAASGPHTIPRPRAIPSPSAFSLPTPSPG